MGVSSLWKDAMSSVVSFPGGILSGTPLRASPASAMALKNSAPSSPRYLHGMSRGSQDKQMRGLGNHGSAGREQEGIRGGRDIPPIIFSRICFPALREFLSMASSLLPAGECKSAVDIAHGHVEEQAKHAIPAGDTNRSNSVFKDETITTV